MEIGGTNQCAIAEKFTRNQRTQACTHTHTRTRTTICTSATLNENHMNMATWGNKHLLSNIYWHLHKILG